MNDLLRAVLPVTEALADIEQFDTIIDVRSPAEFAEDHLPGALNYPVLNDAQRAEVGTLHAQVAPFEARRRGAALAARNIAHHIETAFADKPRNWRPLVYCWRGGERSRAMSHVLERVGWHARRLDGGYRAYRAAVVADLACWPQAFSWQVICGATGTGKSVLLQQLQRQGGQALDLEALAQHRGSILGELPDLPQPSQKRFESLLWWFLRGAHRDRPVFVESESRKVGDLRVPDALIEAMRSARCIRLELPDRERVKLLRGQYAHLERDPARLTALLRGLTNLHGRARIDAWTLLAQTGQWAQLVERLLIDHYDPAYRRSIARNYIRVDTATPLVLGRGDDETFAQAARSLLKNTTLASNPLAQPVST